MTSERSLLNSIPVLDKGSVALVSTSLPYDKFKTIHAEALRRPHGDEPDARMLDQVSVHFKVKCPVFVQIGFAHYGLSYITYQIRSQPEAYIPTVNEVDAMNLEASEAVQRDIERTTEALLINPKAYQAESCNMFVSQVISPVSVYNTLIVTGNLSQWLRYLSQAGFPSPIEAYRAAFEDAISGEFPFFKEMLKRNKYGKASK